MKQDKVKWGVLGAASIATKKVIPGMQKGEWSEITAIASRDLRKAEDAARKLGIPRAYGSYEELLADKEIEAIYNPLPNHLHVPWSIKAAEAGKHVLCEKPLSLNVAEAKTLLPVRDRTGVKIGEAFMVKTHPQWLRTRELIRKGEIGELRAIVGAFSYFNRDPRNVRNKGRRFWNFRRGKRCSRAARSWCRTSGCNSWGRKGGLRSRYRLTRRLIERREFLSMMDAMCLAGEFE